MDWDPAGRRFDAVIAAQSWHWVDPLAAYEAMIDRIGLPNAARERFDWERTYTREQWLDVVPTFGGHSRLPGLERILRRLAEVTPDRFTPPYATVALIATRP